MEPLQHRLTVLPGGLRALTVPMPAMRSMTLLALVRTGSRYEDRPNNGISHFMEHMFFKGAERYPDTMAVAGAIDGAGGSFNAFTGEEIVGYFVKISASRMEIAYDVISDMMINAKFDEKEIRRESGVIVEEIRMHHDDPMGQVSQDFHRVMFGDQPLGWDIAGTEERVLAMTRESFLDHHRKFYHGANCVISAAGAVSPAEHEALCQKYFSFAGGGSPAVPPPFLPQATDRVFFRERATEQAHFIFGFPACPAEHPDETPLKVAGVILGGSMSSRLFYQIRERRGLAYYINAGFATYQDVGLFQVSSGVNLDKIGDALKYALEEVRKMKDEPVTEKELARAKENIKGHTDLALEDSRRVASLYGMRELLYNRIKTPEMLAAEIDAVTAEQIQAASKKYFSDEAVKMAVVGPYKAGVEWEGAFRLP